MPPKPFPRAQKLFNSQSHNEYDENNDEMDKFLGPSASMLNNIFGNETKITFQITTQRRFEKMSDLPKSHLPVFLAMPPVPGKKSWQPPHVYENPIEVPVYRSDLTVFDSPAQISLQKNVKRRRKEEDIISQEFFELDENDFVDFSQDDL